MQRLLFVLSLSFFSLASMAGTTLKFKSGDYEVTATLELEANSWRGTVNAQTQGNGACTGSFNLDFPNNTLSINLDGPSISGGCSNESMTVTINFAQFQSLKQGQEIQVSFVSPVFNNRPRQATVKIIPN